MSKHDDNYRDLLRTMPCFNCDLQQDKMVSWHHVNVGLSGTALKSPSWAAIPTDRKCHDKESPHPSCHNYGIPKDEQEEALLSTWYRVMSSHLPEREVEIVYIMFDAINKQCLGDDEEWKAKGEIYWQALIDHKVI